MMRYFLRRRASSTRRHHEAPKGLAARFFAAFKHGFERLRVGYGRWLGLGAAASFASSSGASSLFVRASFALFPLLGHDFFPSVDAGLIKLHVRGRPGTRIEETERKFAEIENTIEADIPPTRSRRCSTTSAALTAV